MKVWYPTHVSFFIFFAVFCMISCSKKNYPAQSEYSFKSNNNKPDYNQLNYWAAHPWKWDPSDSVAKFYRSNFKKDSLADVFFIYPTTFVNNEDSNWNAQIDDAYLNYKTDYSTILYQSSVFNEKCRVFSPRYRQAHLKAFFTIENIKANTAFETAYTDIKNAFEYYVKNLNKGKPIIIASHSQGTVYAARLIKEYFEGKPLQKKLICAYLIGMPIQKKYFNEITPCSNSQATGCFVSWRTYKKGYMDTAFVAKEKFECVVTNPLTWTTDTFYATSKLNSGAILKNFNKLKLGITDAQVHQNILWSSKPKFFGNIFFTNRNYHIGDINLFYDNIRKNVIDRIDAYLQ